MKERRREHEYTYIEAKGVGGLERPLSEFKNIIEFEELIEKLDDKENPQGFTFIGPMRKGGKMVVTIRLIPLFPILAEE